MSSTYDQILDIFERHLGTALTKDDVRLLDDVVQYVRDRFVIDDTIEWDYPHVVDLKRHNDGEDGIVGTFHSRTAAQLYVDGITDQFVARYATIRPIHQPERRI